MQGEIVIDSYRRLRELQNKLEEREAIRWYRLAQDDSQRAEVRRLYSRALERYFARRLPT